ncbi:MAG: helix-turn-helix transcriptional regulator [Planctomycetes bacterium]|nr:helix-turn-helix transcriptional regulator [Planctomycetota bacterium]
MASLGLKLFYLRTREKKLSQREVAERLGVRQGTISHIEQEVTAPHWSLLVDLCRFYDVTPTFLADEQRGVVPLPTERWGLRNALVTVGMWVEVSRDAVVDTEDDRRLCAIEPGGAFYDAEAVDVRRRYRRGAASQAALAKLRSEQDKQDKLLEAALRREQKEHPRRRRGGD